MDAPKCRTCGERHRLGPCPKFNESRGRGESRPTGKVVSGRRVSSGTDTVRLRQQTTTQPTERKAVMRGALPASNGTGETPSPAREVPPVIGEARVAPGPREPKPKRGHGGRPLQGQEHETLRVKQPWKAKGMSERTWYRRGKPV